MHSFYCLSLCKYVKRGINYFSSDTQHTEWKRTTKSSDDKTSSATCAESTTIFGSVFSRSFIHCRSIGIFVDSWSSLMYLLLGIFEQTRSEMKLLSKSYGWRLFIVSNVLQLWQGAMNRPDDRLTTYSQIRGRSKRLFKKKKTAISLKTNGDGRKWILYVIYSKGGSACAARRLIYLIYCTLRATQPETSANNIQTGIRLRSHSAPSANTLLTAF